MKYRAGNCVEAIYDEVHGAVGNPFLEAMPPLDEKTELFDKIKSTPKIPADILNGNQIVRRNAVAMLSSLFFPMDYMYQVYDTAYRAILSTYMTMNSMECVKQINALLYPGNAFLPRNDYRTQSECGAILGVPGIGKTSTLRRCMDTIPQVIQHTEYRGQMFFCKQILYLFVECPSDCSVKTLGFNIAAAIDRAIGTSYLENMGRNHTASASAVALMIKRLCINHHVGLIIIDEIQNAVQAARQNKQTSRLVKFLVELMNDTCTAVLLVGTLDAEELFDREEHLRRRTRGARLLPMKQGDLYTAFLRAMWSYQMTANKTGLTDKIADLLFDCTNGTPAYMMKLFQEAQVLTILTGRETLDEQAIKDAYGRIAMQTPKRYTQGTSISDFSVQESMDIQVVETRRGRKAKQRELTDLVYLASSVDGTDQFISKLRELGMLEEFAC